NQSGAVLHRRAHSRHAALILSIARGLEPMLPLQGITVVAVEQAVAAPFCSTRLADAGATVIKVERPEGDFARDYDANIKGQSCCSISGYGDSGPYAQRKAYDLLIQAESGLCSVTGGTEAASRVGISVVDVSTGATAHAAILEALFARTRTGEGCDIRVSMFDVMADWMSVPLLNTEAGKPPPRMGLSHPSIAPYGAFRSIDGKD